MHRQIKHCNRIIEGLSAKEAISKGSHSRETSAQKWDAYMRKKRKPNPSNSDLMKLLTDDDINKHYFLVTINMQH